MADDVVGRPRWSIAPYFIVDDIVATAKYYLDKLGFSCAPPNHDAADNRRINGVG